MLSLDALTLHRVYCCRVEPTLNGLSGVFAPSSRKAGRRRKRTFGSLRTVIAKGVEPTLNGLSVAFRQLAFAVAIATERNAAALLRHRLPGEKMTQTSQTTLPQESGPSRRELLSRNDIEREYKDPSRRWLEIAALRGDGPPMIRLSRRMVRYQRGVFEDWLASRTVSSTSQPVEAA